MKKKVGNILIISICFILFLTGCGEKDIVTNVSPRESVEILVLLRRAGIQAKRVASNNSSSVKYKIQVDDVNYKNALEILYEYGLPRKSDDSLDNILKNKRFIPSSPDEINFKVDHLLGMQIERLLNVLPGVIEVRAVVRSKSYKKAKNIDSKIKPSASIVIRYSSDNEKPLFDLKEVNKIVTRTIPEIDESSISIKTVKIFNNSTFTSVANGSSETKANYVKLQPFSFHVIPDEKRSAQIQLVILMFVICLIGAFIGLFTGFKFKRRSGVFKNNSQIGVYIESPTLSREQIIKSVSYEDDRSNE